MPLYDFECRHGHRFERQCKIAERKEEIPCEGQVNQVVEEELFVKHSDSYEPLPDDLFWMTIGHEEPLPPGVEEDDGQIEQVLMRKAPCQLKASLIATGANLHHNWGANREDALADRYDPLYPNTRSIGGGKDLNRK